eukprot:scaffold30943_cov99-Skeletonema_marinoi.AAC.1
MKGDPPGFILAKALNCTVSSDTAATNAFAAASVKGAVSHNFFIAAANPRCCRPADGAAVGVP